MRVQQFSESPQPQQYQRYQFNIPEVQMRHYFYKMPDTYKWFLILGIILFLFGVTIGQLFGAFGGFMIVVGLGCLVFVVVLYVVYESKPTEQQYTNWVAERTQALYKTALQRLHIVDPTECECIIEVQGGISSLLQLTKKFPEKEIVVKRLSNGRRHYSINVSLYIFLLKNEIAIYSGYINALAQSERFEDADHYYYKDIVGVSTSGPIYMSSTDSYEPESNEFILHKTETQMQGFLIRAANGDVVGTDYARKIILREEEGKVEIQGVDAVVAMLLQLLRSHKLSSIEANKTASDII